MHLRLQHREIINFSFFNLVQFFFILASHPLPCVHRPIEVAYFATSRHLRDIRAGICMRVSQSTDATIGCTSKFLIVDSIIVDLSRAAMRLRPSQITVFD